MNYTSSETKTEERKNDIAEYVRHSFETYFVPQVTHKHMREMRRFLWKNYFWETMREMVAEFFRGFGFRVNNKDGDTGRNTLNSLSPMCVKFWLVEKRYWKNEPEEKDEAS